MLNSIFHPRLLASLPKIFNSLCTIELETVIQDPNSGEETISYLADVEMTDIPCYVEPGNVSAGSGEIRRPDQTIVERPWKIALQGYYPTIDVEDRAIIDGTEIHNILNVTQDDTHTHTYLDTEIIS